LIVFDPKCNTQIFLTSHSSSVIDFDLDETKTSAVSIQPTMIVLWNLETAKPIKKIVTDAGTTLIAVRFINSEHFVVLQRCTGKLEANFFKLSKSAQNIEHLHKVSLPNHFNDRNDSHLYFELHRNSKSGAIEYFVTIGTLCCAISQPKCADFANFKQTVFDLEKHVSVRELSSQIVHIFPLRSNEFAVLFRDATCIHQVRLAPDDLGCDKETNFSEPKVEVRTVSLGAQEAQIRSSCEFEQKIYIGAGSGQILVYDGDLKYIRLIENCANGLSIESIQFRTANELVLNLSSNEIVECNLSGNQIHRIFEQRAPKISTFEVVKAPSGQILIAVGDANGWLQFYCQKERKLIKALELCPGDSISKLKASPKPHFILVGTSRGKMYIVDTSSFEIIEHNSEETHTSELAIIDIEISTDNTLFTYINAESVVSTFHVQFCKNSFIVTILGHFKSSLNFTPGSKPVQIFLYKNEFKVRKLGVFSYQSAIFTEFDLPNSSALKNVKKLRGNGALVLNRQFKIESEIFAIENLAIYYENSEPFLIAFQADCKLRFYSLSGATSRRLIRLPNVEKSGNQQIWSRFAQRGDLTVMAANQRVYFASGPLTGNPHQFIGQTVARRAMRHLAFVSDSQIVSLDSDGALFLWDLNTDRLKAQIAQGGAEFDPFYALIGGKHSRIYSLIEMCAIYHQCGKFEHTFTEKPQIANRIAIDCVPDTFLALGINLTASDRECLLNELRFEGVALSETKENTHVSVETIVKCVANYRSTHLTEIEQKYDELRKLIPKEKLSEIESSKVQEIHECV